MLGDYVPNDDLLEPCPAAIEAGVKALIKWHDGDKSFEEGIRQIWLQMRIAEKGMNVQQQRSEPLALACNINKVRW